jgi:hypothetical protein
MEVMMIAGPFLLFSAAAWLMNRLSLSKHEFAFHRASAEFVASRWLNLYHEHDEAVEGLGSIQDMRVSIFSPNFAVNPLLLLGTALVPLILLTFAYRPFTVPYLIQPWASEFDGWANQTVNPWLNEMYRTYGMLFYWLYILVGATVMALLIFVIALCLLGILYPLSTLLSAALSRTMNHLTMKQMRQAAFGGDTRGEIAMRSMHNPYWWENTFNPLPIYLSAALSCKADEAASIAVPKLRAAIGKLAFALADSKPQVTVTEFITWDELIHTVYFKVPAFSKFVCYAIAHSPGFRPSEKLRTDPDYEKFEQWLDEIQGDAFSSPS